MADVPITVRQSCLTLGWGKSWEAGGYRDRHPGEGWDRWPLNETLEEVTPARTALFHKPHFPATRRSCSPVLHHYGVRLGGGDSDASLRWHDVKF